MQRLNTYVVIKSTFTINMKQNQAVLPALILLLILLIPFAGFSQKWVADSITIDFGSEKMSQSAILVNSVSDLREESSTFISVFEQKKALVFPVDQIVKLQRPLESEFVSRFTPDTTVNINLKVDIQRFYINQSTSLGKRNYTLFSTLEVYNSTQSDSSFLGTFYYEYFYTNKEKDSLTSGYEAIIDKWSHTFVTDVMSVSVGLDNVIGDNLYHFRRGQHAIRKNFYTEVEAFAGLNFWGIDGALWFSEPEGNRVFNRQIGIMRYVNRPTFQSIAVGRNVRMWNYRFTDKWLFTNKIAMLVGFNNWKDMDTVPHKMEEILVLNASMTQRINYNQFDKSGLVFGLGVMEDFYYVVYNKPKLSVGLTLNCAYKF